MYEDLYDMGKSKLLKQRIDARENVVNVQNKRKGVPARRGDGTFGELIPGIAAVVVDGFTVAQGRIANVEIGAEAKVLAKAMNKQVGRVMTDLIKQVDEFNKGAGSPICVGIIGINHSPFYVSYEKDVVWRTTGKSPYLHPIQEAMAVERKINDECRAKFNELIFLRYRVTNEAPYPFEWVNFVETYEQYSAALVRISREYDQRFT